MRHSFLTVRLARCHCRPRLCCEDSEHCDAASVELFGRLLEAGQSGRLAAPLFIVLARHPTPLLFALRPASRPRAHRDRVEIKPMGTC